VAAAADAAQDGGTTVTALELRGVSKTYGQGAAQVHALAEVDLTLDEGAMVAVMGPSGSGKSTLLTIAGSLEEPTSGEVLVGGRALAGMSRNAKARLRRRSIGYVFQDFNLLPGLTAAENVALPPELDGVSARKARAAACRPSMSSAWPGGPAGSPISCRAGNGNGWRSPGPWWGTAGCCWPTSRRGHWTR